MGVEGAHPRILLRKSKSSQKITQNLGFAGKTMAGRRRFLHHGSVLLRVLVHGIDGVADLPKRGRLFACGFHDRGDVAVDLDNLGNDVLQRRAGLPDQRDASRHLLRRRRDQRLDLAGCCGRPLGQFTYFLGNDRKTSSRLAGTRCLDACVQRQQVGLEGDLVDHAQDAADLLRRGFDLPHCVDGIAHDVTRMLGALAGLGHQRSCFLGAPGAVGDGAADLFQRRCGFFDGRCLLFRALRQAIGCLLDFARTGSDTLGILVDGVHGVTEPRDCTVEVDADLLKAGNKGPVDGACQVAFGQARQSGGDLVDGSDALGNVGRELHDLEDLAVCIQDRVVGRLYPDHLAALADALEFCGHRLTFR